MRYCYIREARGQSRSGILWVLFRGVFRGKMALSRSNFETRSRTGIGAVGIARALRVREVPGSSPGSPTIQKKIAFL